MKILLIMILGLYLNAAALSEQAQNGQELYSDANCKKCHGMDQSYQRKNKAERKTDVTKWVRQCDAFFDIGWFPEEHVDVAKYLNEIYYKK